MSLRKVVKVQTKFMKETWSYSCGGDIFRFKHAKNHSANGEALNTLVALTVTKALKMNKSSKAKTTDNSDLEN